MFVKYYLLVIILLSSVCFAQSSNSSTDDYSTIFESTSDDIMTVISTTADSVTTLESTDNDTTTLESNSSVIVNLMTTSMSEPTDETEMSSEISVPMSPSSVVYSSMANNLSSTDLTTSINSASTASTVTNAPIAINISEIYIYNIQSVGSLQTGIINNTIATNAVQALVNASFNLPGFNIRVIQSRIESSAKDNQYYNLLVNILFTSSRNNCDITCIDQAKLAPNITISLPGVNNTRVNSYAGSAPTQQPVTTTTTIPNYPIGGPSPGIPSQLGMGLGISLIGVLLIAEIIFLYWKYGLSDSPRRQEYAMTY